MGGDIDTSAAPEGGLAVSGLDAGYGHAQVLFDVHLAVRPGELVALLGTNGAGKTTLLNAIGGTVRPTSGMVRFDGKDLTTANAVQTLRAGVVVVPGGRGVFPDLSVQENLRLAAWLYEKDRSFVSDATERVLHYFPILRQRWRTAAGNLSGGEQQMLTLAQGFIAKPKLLMIDELSLGLAPTIVEQLLEIVTRIHDEGVAVLMVEQSANVALSVAERALFMEKGEIRFEGSPGELLKDPDIIRAVFLEGLGSEALATPRQEPEVRTRPAAHCPGCGSELPVLLSVRGLTKTFGAVTAVDDVSFDLREGEILGLIGQNGAGKTTIFDLISGFLVPDAGRIELAGAEVTQWSPDARAWLGLGRSFQDSRLFPALSVAETVAVALERHVEVRQPLAAAVVSPAVRLSEEEVADRVWELLDSLSLTPYEDRFVGELPTGVRRLVDLACVLAHEPDVLLLDEPSSGIAQRETEELGRILLDVRERTGASLLVIEHDMPMITSISDEIVALELGQVITRDAPEAVIRHPRVVASYLGGDAEHLPAPAGPAPGGGGVEPAEQKRRRPLRARR